MNQPLQQYNQGSIPPAPGYFQTQSYPIEYFPAVLKNVIRSLHDNTQIPVELIGNVVLAAASLACQSLIEVIQPHTNLPEQCSLYLLTVAASGEGKTTINKQVMKPFYDFASEMKQEYEVRLSDYKRENKIWKVKQQALDSNLRQAIKKGYSGENEELEIEKHARKEPQKPAHPNFIYEDASLKALIEGLSEHPEAGFISDEAITFFKSYLKNNPGLLNKAWDGETYDFRRADGEVYEITPCLTFSLMVQPGVFIDYLRKHGELGRASGFLSRFLFSWGDSTLGYRNGNAVYSSAEYDLNVFYEKIATLLEEKKKGFHGENIKKKTLKLSDKAMMLWRNNRAKTEQKMTAGHEWEHIRDIASKSSANTLRMAAIFQHINDDSSEIIEQETMALSISIMDWYMSKASELFYPMSERYQFEQDVRDMHSWIMSKIRQNDGYAILKNDVEKYGPNRLRRMEKLTPVLDQLISQGYFGIIQMFSHNAFYIAIHHRNDSFTLPRGVGSYSRFSVIQSLRNTRGRPYAVNIT